MSAKRTLGLAAVLVLVLGGATAYAAYSNEGTYDQTKTVDAATVSSVKVQVQDVNVHVIPSNDTRITAHLYGQGVRDVYVLNTKSEGNQLQIEIDTPQQMWHWALYQNLTLDVKMPKKLYDQFEVNASSGNLQIDGMQASGNVALSTSSGNIAAQNIQCQTFATTTSSGNINLQQVLGNTTNLETSSGNVNAEGLQASSLTAGSSSGNLELDQVTSDAVQSHSSSGNVQLLFTKTPKSLTVNTSSGNAKLFLPADSAFTLDYTTGSGDETVDFPIRYDRQDKHGYHGTVGENGASVQVHTGSGNLSVLKK